MSDLPRARAASDARDRPPEGFAGESDVPSRVASTRFLVLGAGGLGCPALVGLVAAGARHLTIVDPDHVEAHNLQRQTLFDTSVIGAPKAWAAAHALSSRVRPLHTHAIQARWRASELRAFMEQAQANVDGAAVVWLDCTDDAETKFEVSALARALGVPCVIGGALDWRATCFAQPPGAACYACAFDPSAQRLGADAETCAVRGVLGPACGLGGALMASAAVGLATATLVRARLLAADLRASHLQSLEFDPDPHCRHCRSLGA